MRIGFAILLDNECHNYSRKLELELCEKFGLCWGLKQSPHITIKAPFETEENLEVFIEYLKRISNDIKPFEIEIKGFGYFGNKVIFLDVKESEELHNIHNRILNYLKENYKINPLKTEGENVKFHSTLATHDVSPEKFERGRNYLVNKYVPSFKFIARTLGIFYYLGEEAGWIIVQRIKLG
jgi:2'-5' RNA ligase